MKKARNIVAAGALTIAMGVTSITVFAAAKYDSPQEALAGMTGKTTEQIVEKKAMENKSYGAIAAEEGKLEEFKVEIMERKREVIQERVAEGILEQEDADAILERIQERQETCIGEGNVGEGMMKGLGTRLGNGPQNGEGKGAKVGSGIRNGNGSGRNK